MGGWKDRKSQLGTNWVVRYCEEGVLERLLVSVCRCVQWKRKDTQMNLVGPQVSLQ